MSFISVGGCLSSGSPVKLGRDKKRQEKTGRSAAVAAAEQEQELARCQRPAHYEASIGVSILARQTDKSKVSDERQAKGSKREKGGRRETLARRRGGDKEGRGEAFYGVVSEGREAIMKRCC